MEDRVFERRFSEHPAFWAACVTAVTLIYVYIFGKLNEARPQRDAGAIWLLLCFSMTGLSYVARRTETIRGTLLRRWMDRAGSVWLLFAIFSFSVLISFEAAGKIFSVRLPAGAEVAAAFLLALAAIAAGMREAQIIETTRITIETEKLPPELPRLRIVQLTDLHLGPYSGVKLLARVLRRVREEEPDMVVATGDVADGPLEGRRREIAMFRRLKLKYGFFAVMGNHDFYDDEEKARAFMRHAGMRLLDAEAEYAGGIVVEGVSDRDHLLKEKWNLSRSETLIVNTKSRNPDKFILLLRHRPVVEIGTQGMFDLQLSGHTHGGQLLPYPSSRLFLRGHSRGVKKLKNGSMLYVSNGVGYVGPPLRFFAPPEIVVIDLVRKNGSPPEERR